MPKKYISISLGLCDLHGSERTPLTILFQSVCTTDVNGTIYKLKSKGDDPLRIEFDDNELLMKVNANKSDPLQLCINWADFFIMTQPEDNPNEPEKLLNVLHEAHALGLDLRGCKDPFVATHYLALTSEVDHNLRVCVLRGLPIITKEWLKFACKNLSNVSKWGERPPEELLLRCGHSSPQIQRLKLLEGHTIFICHENSAGKDLVDFVEWIRCLLPASVYIANLKTDAKEIIKVANLDKEILIFGFGTFADSPYCSLLTEVSNNGNDLWASLVAINTSNLQSVLSLKLQIEPQKDGTEIFWKRKFEESGEISKPTQKKRRQKVERVDETQFFLFSLAVAPIQEPCPSLNVNQLEIELRPKTLKSDAKRVDDRTNEEVEQTKKFVKPDAQILLSAEKSSDTLEFYDSLSLEFSEHAERKINAPEQLILDHFREASIAKKARILAPCINPISFVEAVINTKLKAEENIRKELYEGELIEGGIENLVILEEMELKRPVRLDASISFIPQYKGRKNFKAFRKVGAFPKSVTRTFLQLNAEDSHVLGKSVGKISVRCRVAEDFSEMGSVSGYQPESQPLFVAEEPENEGNDGNFSLLSSTTKNPVVEHDDESEDEIRFKFST